MRLIRGLSGGVVRLGDILRTFLSFRAFPTLVRFSIFMNGQQHFCYIGEQSSFFFLFLFSFLGVVFLGVFDCSPV